MSSEPYTIEKLHRAPPRELPRDLSKAVWTSRWARGMARLRTMRPSPGPQDTPTKAQHIINLANQWTRQKAEVETLELALKARQKAIREMEEIEIPDALDDADLEKLMLPDGSTLSAPPEFLPQYHVEDSYKVHTWLRANGFADRLKRTVTVEFGMGDDDLAGRFVAFVSKHLPGKWKDRVYIHSGTEKVIGREITEQGLSLPEELTIFPLRRAKIVRPRVSKRNGQDGS